MSTSPDIDAELSQWLIFNYILLSAFILYTLHYVHTIPLELRAVWLRKPTGVSILFLLNRHGFMLNQILTTAANMPGSISQSSCTALVFANFVLNTITTFATEMLLILRVYAIYGMNKIILIVGLVLVIPTIAINIYLSTGLSAVTTAGSLLSQFTACATNPDYVTLESTMDILLQFLPLAAETLMLSLLLFKVGGVVREMRRMGETSILQILQRDGVLCYVALIVASVTEATPDIIALTGGDSNTVGGSVSWVLSNIISPFFYALETIAVNTMFLNLRNSDNFSQGSKINGLASSLPEINFAQNRFLGNIGAPIESGQCDQDSEGLEEEGVENEDELVLATTTLVPVIREGSANDIEEEIQMVPVDRTAHTTP